MKKVLVTGAAGFIGFSLCKELSKKKYQCMGIDNFNNYYDLKLKLDRKKLLKKKYGVKIVKLDLTNNKKLKYFFNHNKFDLVYHLAAQAGVRYSLKNPSSYIDSNLLGTFNLLENLRHQKTKHFLFSSTSSVYGKQKINSKGFKESDDSSRPLSIYAASKKSCENLIHSYAYNFGIKATVFRFFTVYGPWGRPDMALFKFVKGMENNTRVEVFNNGNMWRDFTYIDDLVKSIFKLSKVLPLESTRVSSDSLSNSAPFRVVNIGNQNAIKLSSFIKKLEKISNKKLYYNYLPMQLGDVPFTLSNSSLLNKLINFVPNTNIEKGIKKFYDWYIDYYSRKKIIENVEKS